MGRDPLDIYGAYAEGYCFPLAPSALPHFYHASGSVTFSRLPDYPTYEMVFDQATETTAGNVTVSYAPFAQELLLRLPWPRMPKANKEALESFYKTAVRGTAEQFTYANNGTGPELPVRFAEASVPIMPEVAFEQYEVSLALRVAINFPQLVVNGVAPAIAGNRFVFGPVALSLPIPIKGGTGRGLVKVQTFGRDSAGDPVIYDKSRIVQIPHALEILHDHDTFAAIQAFFFSYTNGARKPFAWIDQAGISRTVRLSGTRIISKQLGCNRFQTGLNLIEEGLA